MTLLEKDPANRVPNAAALARALSGDTSAIPAPDHGGASAAHVVAGLAAAVRDGAGLATARRARSGDALPGHQRGDRALEGPRGRKFRSSFGTFAFVNGVIVIASIFGHGDFFVVTVLWTIIMAFKYAKLWNAGYDWRDVFRQPRDRGLMDVASERSTRRADSSTRSVARCRAPSARSRPCHRCQGVARSRAPHSITSRTDMGPYRGTVQRAEQDRDEILRLVGSLPASDQTLVEGVVPATEALFQRIQLLAQGAAADEKSSAPDALAQIEAQISELEAQANPLEVRASEDRVRRLAFLKRQRRGVADLARRARRHEGEARDLRARAPEHAPRHSAPARRIGRQRRQSHHAAHRARALARRRG